MTGGGLTMGDRLTNMRLKTRPRRRTIVTAALVGAAAAHYFDPDRGRARRAQLHDQTLAAGRRIARQADRMGRRRVLYLRDHAVGSVRHAWHNVGRMQPDDTTLTQKIRSEVLGRAEFRPYSITVDAADGVVHLRGQVPAQRAIDDLIAAVERVHGVGRVESYLHLPGETAPNKQAVLSG